MQCHVMARLPQSLLLLCTCVCAVLAQLSEPHSKDEQISKEGNKFLQRTATEDARLPATHGWACQSWQHARMLNPMHLLMLMPMLMRMLMAWLMPIVMLQCPCS